MPKTQNQLDYQKQRLQDAARQKGVNQYKKVAAAVEKKYGVKRFSWQQEAITNRILREPTRRLDARITTIKRAYESAKVAPKSSYDRYTKAWATRVARYGPSGKFSGAKAWNATWNSGKK